MGSIDESYALLAAQYVRKQVTTLARHIQGAREAKDIECVHQARVATRRLRAALRMFEDCFSGKQLRTWRKGIRRLTKGLGPARDKDVQIEFVREFLDGLTDRAARPGVRRLLLRLRQQRAAIQPKVVRAADRLAASGLVKDMRGAAKARLADLKARDVQLQSPFVFLQAERRIVRRLEEVLAYQDCLSNAADIERHHEMRIVTKRLRYTLEICRPVYDGDLDDAIEAAKALQTLLGDIHDCDVWTDYLPQFEQEERARTVAYYGHAGPFKRLRVGIEHLRQDRGRHRDETFVEAGELWRRLAEKGTWDGIVSTVLSRVQQPPSPAGEPAPTQAAPEAPAAAEPSEPGDPAEPEAPARRAPVEPGRQAGPLNGPA